MRLIHSTFWFVVDLVILTPLQQWVRDQSREVSGSDNGEKQARSLDPQQNPLDTLS